jgi:hypothetical protein
MANPDQLEQALFNWELCADLHNRILEIGWEVLTDETGWEQDMDSWWEYYFGREDDEDNDDEAEVEKDDPEKDEKDPRLTEELQQRLHPDIVKFLNKARHDYRVTGSHCHFFYYLQGLPRPRDIIKALDNDILMGFVFSILDPPQINQMVWLYKFPEQLGGLV